MSRRNHRGPWTVLKMLLVLLAGISSGSATETERTADGWLHWRGPLGTGVSLEQDLPDDVGENSDALLWTYPISGGGTPVIAGERVYLFAYTGEGTDLREALICLHAGTGELIWERRFNDFLSDIVYNRYAIGSPVVDPHTGNVYLMTSAGLVLGFSAEGDLLWEHSMMEEFGRLTFPNGRTGSPSVDGDLVIVRGITANWGSNGPARDRFYAFDKNNGDLVWFSTPGVLPKDSSFAPLTFGWLDGRRAFYSGTGCGNIVCIDARTGTPLWRFQMSRGGVNSAVVLAGEDLLVAIHGKENLDTSTTGRMVALRLPRTIPDAADLPLVLGAADEIWRNHLESFTSSPLIHEGRIYQTVRTGELVSVDAGSGREIWRLKLSHDQLHASPLWADGKLYVPMLDGKLFVIRPDAAAPVILSERQLDGGCIAAPAAHAGRVYVHSKNRLYCFGAVRPTATATAAAAHPIPGGPATTLQIVPAEFAVPRGATQPLVAWSLDPLGRRLDRVNGLEWKKLRGSLPEMRPANTLAFPREASVGTTVLEVNKGSLGGSVRGRILAGLPYSEDFESFALNQTTAVGTPFAYPPSPWLGARLRWQVIGEGDEQMLANTLDRVLFQRSMTFIGHPNTSDYTIEADVMTDGNRRMKSNVGLINQRYLISLIGNWQILEVVSNHDRVKVSVPFPWAANTWYRLKARVDRAPDGSGVVRAKAWPISQSEPHQWTIEVPHRNAHKHGSPGIFGFSPQSQKRVYFDNISIYANHDS